MTELLENPWSTENNNRLTTWLRAAKLSGAINENFQLAEIIAVIDNAEKLDLLENMSREEAVLLVGLWTGRYTGQIETNKWIPKDTLGKTDIENLEESCQALLEADTNYDFWETLARLKIDVDRIHPENFR